ncbi:MAG: hypothetical protein ACI8T1_004853 [Verrucomicrobiales bacterium]|jgi:hypothetical protein
MIGAAVGRRGCLSDVGELVKVLLDDWHVDRAVGQECMG